MTTRFHFGPPSGGEPIPIVSLRFVDDLSQLSTLELSALVDTGADGTIVPLAVLQNAGFRPNRQRRRLFSWRSEQPPETVLGYTVSLHIANLVLNEVDIYGSRSANDVILGRNVLNRLTFTYDGPQQLPEVIDVDG
jgi:predicted aspartyl protease